MHAKDWNLILILILKYSKRRHISYSYMIEIYGWISPTAELWSPGIAYNFLRDLRQVSIFQERISPHMI